MAHEFKFDIPSDSLFKSLIENINDVIYIVDRDRAVRYISPAITKLNGFLPEEIIGRNFLDFVGDNREILAQRWTSLKDFDTTNNEYKIYSRTGEMRWIRLSSKGIFENGEFVGGAGTMVDMTEQKKAEEELRRSENRYRTFFESNSSTMLLVDPATGAIKDANPAACAFYGWPLETLCQMNDDQINVLSRDKILMELQAAKLEARSHFNFRHRLASGEIRDVEVHSNPMEFGDTILLYSIVHDVTDRIQAENALAESEALYHSILTASPDDITITDMQGKISYVSPQGLKIFGYNHLSELLGRYVGEFIAPEDRERGRNDMMKMRPGANGLLAEYKAVRADGSLIHTEIKGEFILDESGVPAKMVFIIRDITQRKQTEEKLDMLNRLNAVLSHVNLAIIREKNKEDLLKKVCSIAIESGGFRMAWIGFVDRETKLVVPLFKAGFESHYLDEIRQIIASDEPEGKGPIGRAIQEGRPYVCNDTANDPNFTPWREEALSRNYRSMISLPLKRSDRIFGAFNLYSERENFFNTEEVDLLFEVVDNVCYALDALDSEEERKRNERELRKVSKVVEQSPVQVIITNLHGMIEYVNPNFTTVTGYTAEDVVGRSTHMLSSGKTPVSVYENLWKTISSGKEWHGEWINKKKNGDFYWESVSVTPIHDDSGGLLHFVAIKQDITEQKKTEQEIREWNETLEQKIQQRTEELAETNRHLLTAVEERTRLYEALSISEQKFSTAFQSNSAMMAISYSESGKYMDVNHAFLDTLGYSLDEVLGKSNAELKLFDQDPLYEAVQLTPSDSWNIRRLEVSLRTKDGIQKTGLLSADPLVIGGKSCLLIVLLDITERKIMEDELRFARQEAVKANQAKSEFLSRMSHELRTPMNSILGFAQLLEMQGLNAAQSKGVNQIMRSGKHLLRLINEVLDLARIEAGRFVTSIEPVVIRNIVTEIMDVLQPLAADNQVVMSLLPSDALRRIILTDKQCLRQILMNLLNNAIKYNQKGGTIDVRAVLLPSDIPTNQFIRISITDTGNGLPAEHLTKLFNPFERMDALNSGIEGTGLGLAVVKKLMDVLGGHVGVESTVGKGSTFWIELPVSDECYEESMEAEDVAPSSASVSTKTGTILYIEDIVSNIELVEQALELTRPNIRLISNMAGSQAVALALDYKPNMILLDLNLPDMHGSEVLRLLQSDERTRSIPVVVVSADAMDEQVKRLLHLGACNYLTKPLDTRELLLVVDAYLPSEWDQIQNLRSQE